jgi:hypothetical protein
MATGMGGGVSSKIMGGNFADGFKVALLTAAAAYVYNSTVGYEAPKNGAYKLAGEKGTYNEILGVPKDININVFGTNTSKLSGNFFNDFFKQGGALSNTAQHVFGMNAISRLHDSYQLWFDKIAGVSDSWTRTILNVPAMVPAAVISYAALMSDQTVLIQQLQQYKN